MDATTKSDRREPPQYLEILLRNIGGVNVYGEPNFRLAWAPSRLRPSGGVWLDWLPGMAIKDRNRSRGAKPWRRSVGVRMVRRYGPVTGWVLEKWVSPAIYGSRERWYSPAIVGGTLLHIIENGQMRYVPSQGDYPSRGDYEYTGFCFEDHQLSEGTVVPCMQAILRNVEEMFTDPARRVAYNSFIANEAAKAADDAYEKWGLDLIHDAGPAFGGNAFVGQGPKSPHSSKKVLERLGITSHHI